MSAGFRTSGGEGGIRTLGTGVSPYNGLAIVCSVALLCNPKDLQSYSRIRTHQKSPHSSLSGHHSGQ